MKFKLFPSPLRVRPYPYTRDIPLGDILDGRFARYGVTATLFPSEADRSRFGLIHAQQVVQVVLDEDACVEYLHWIAGTDQNPVFDAFMTEFRVQLFSIGRPEFWGITCDSEEKWQEELARIAAEARARFIDQLSEVARDGVRPFQPGNHIADQVAQMAWEVLEERPELADRPRAQELFDQAWDRYRQRRSASDPVTDQEKPLIWELPRRRQLRRN